MINLLIQSKFRKYIKAGLPGKLPPEVRDIIYKISNNIPVKGEIIRPVTDISIVMGIIFGIPVFLFFSFVIIPMVTDIYYLLGVLLIFFYFGEFTFLKGVIFPLWIKKHFNKYFIYIGEKGIIKKNMYTAAFIPFDKLIGAKAYFGSSGYGTRGASRVFLELIVKEGSLFNPVLVTLQSPFLSDITDYSRDDLKRMENLINDKLK